MKKNTPNSEFEPRLFANLPSVSIVGRSASQKVRPNAVSPRTLDERDVENIARSVFTSTTPSVVRNTAPQLPLTPDREDTYVLGLVEGELRWITTESIVAAINDRLDAASISANCDNGTVTVTLNL